MTIQTSKISVYQIIDFSDMDEPDSSSLPGFPPVEERSRPDGAEEELPDQNRGTSGDDGDDEEDDEENDEEYDSVPQTFDRLTSSQVLPWGAPKERARFPSNVNIETDIRPGEFVMRTLVAEFTIQVGYAFVKKMSTNVRPRSI